MSETPNPEEKQKMEDLLTRECLTQAELERFGVAVDPITNERPDPFGDRENPEDIYRPAMVQALEGIIWEATTKRQILVVTGEVGMGKTTVLRRVYGTTRREKRVRLLTPGTLNREKINHKTLAVTILRDLIGKDTSNLAQESRDNLLRQTLASQRGLLPVLFIDEAHLLPNSALIALKHIWDSHALFKQLAIILFGWPTLAARMTQDPDIREFTFRARLVDLPAYDLETTRGYLDWRFKTAGVKAAEIFSPGALDIICKRGRTPLKINALAVRAMRAAAPTGRRVEAEHAGRV